MQFLHFAPPEVLKRIARLGLKPVARKNGRIGGVFAFPLVPGVPPTVSNVWRRELRSRSAPQRRYPVVFRLNPDEQVFFFEDYMQNRKEAETVAVSELGARLQKLLRLTTPTFDEWLHTQGDLERVQQARRAMLKIFKSSEMSGLEAGLYEAYFEDRQFPLSSCPEVVVPFRIQSSRIVKIIERGKPVREHGGGDW